MLINIKQVAKDFKVSTRTIQMWCKAEGIKKIANEYQLTNDIIEAWRIDRTKTKTKSTNENASVTKQKNTSQRTIIIITDCFLDFQLQISWIIAVSNQCRSGCFYPEHTTTHATKLERTSMVPEAGEHHWRKVLQQKPSQTFPG